MPGTTVPDDVTGPLTTPVPPSVAPVATVTAPVLMEPFTYSVPLLIAVGPVMADAGGNERNQLRETVQQQCVPNWLRHRDPRPCISVSVAGPAGSPRGFAVLPDRKGGAHLLLISIEPLTGLESSAARGAGAPSYFQAAWAARVEMMKLIGYKVSRNAIGLAVNSRSARSQDQFHIHIECLGRHLYEMLTAAEDQIGEVLGISERKSVRGLLPKLRPPLHSIVRELV